MMDRIDKNILENLCSGKSITVEELATAADVHFKTLQRAQKTGYIPSKVLKSISKVLNVKPKELTRPMPISISGMSGLD